jgi:hypothetical protein
MVVDRDGPVVGAVVALIISEAGPAPKAVMTGADGRYSFDAVAAGRYNVSASFAGSDPVASAPFAVADGGAIEVAPLSVEVETIEVNAKTDEVPVRGNTTTGETFQASKLEYIPTARSYTEVLKIAPGVSEDTSEAIRRLRRGSRSTAPRPKSPRTSSTASTRRRSIPAAPPRTSTTTSSTRSRSRRAGTTQSSAAHKGRWST